jgi:hypothetical protein
MAAWSACLLVLLDILAIVRADRGIVAVLLVGCSLSGTIFGLLSFVARGPSFRAALGACVNGLIMLTIVASLLS